MIFTTDIISLLALDPIPRAASWAAPAFGYLVGSFPTAYIMGRMARGIDIREHGSGNVGATNALRVLGTRLGVACLLIDLAKGAIPVVIATRALDPTWSATPWLIAATALATILGHIFTIFLKFRGGKGVASTVGAMIALDPAPVGIAIALGVLAIYLTRMVSVGSLLIAAGMPLMMAIFAWKSGALAEAGFLAPFLLAVILMTLIFVSHRSNIQRLLKGEEKKLGQEAGKAPDG